MPNTQDPKVFSTKMQVYTPQTCVCPSDMNIEKCPLRKKLSELEQEYHIGYKVLPDGTLNYPGFAYSMTQKTFIDVENIQANICNKCFSETR